MSNGSAALKACQPGVSPALLEHPSRLYLETTSRCNLNCVMCMKQNGAADGGGEGDLQLTTFQTLVGTLPNLDALVLNGVGEPLLNTRLELFISRAKKLMPAGSWVGFQSNGLLLTNLRAVSLLDAGVDWICLSMDGVDDTTFSSIRAGSMLQDLEHALEALVTAKRVCGRPEMEIGIEFVAMRENLSELPAALEWAAARGARFAIVSNLHPFDEPHLERCSFDLNSDEAIGLYQSWKSKADLKRLDISRYFDILWNYDKSPREREILDFVAAMKADAQQRGITLDLKRLFALDGERIAQTQAAFDEALRAARRVGLTLRLPDIVRRERRSCGFIEQGAAFVSWDGAVHPCYQLWHRCRSFANGWLHPVKPRVFGSLKQHDIVEIWNSAPYRQYRENVLRHDYPSCSECTFSPCDLVQQEHFGEDCYVNSEPCGSCLWSSGIFRCLD